MLDFTTLSFLLVKVSFNMASSSGESVVKRKFGKGVTLNSQARNIVYSVACFFKEEAANDSWTIPIEKWISRTADATGISEATVRRIIKEGDDTAASSGQANFLTPHKKRPKISKVSGIDSFDQEAIRRIVYSYHLNEKVRPTLSAVLSRLKEDNLFSGGKSSLRRMLHQIGFRWRKSRDNMGILMELPDVRAKRTSFLREMMQYRKEGRTIIYSDESYLHASHTKGKEWSDDSGQGLKTPIGKGRRLIIVHAGGEQGFIEDALLIFPSGSKSGDYHDDMNFENYSKWLKEKLIPKLPPKSVLVIDNASYHNKFLDKLPTSNSLKSEMIKWLTEKKIPADSSLTKPELYVLIKQNKPFHLKFSTDDILSNHGHTVLRLPPYHPCLNPIEKIWAIVKDTVARENVTFNLKDVQKLAENKFASIGRDVWQKLCDHVKRIEAEYMEREHLLDSHLESVIINLADDSEWSDFEDDDEENDDFDASFQTLS